MIVTAETMGDRIRVLRGARNLTQTKLAELCGVSRGAVAQWELGMVENIRLKAVLRLVEVLGTDVAYLVYGQARKPQGLP
jgi:transcriptional regulator with XRE-family HTH domain